MPFNKYCPPYTGPLLTPTFLTGLGPIAAAQLMAWAESDFLINGEEKVDWKYLKEDGPIIYAPGSMLFSPEPPVAPEKIQTMAAQLILDIGRSGIGNLIPSGNGVSLKCHTAGLVNLLNKYGFSTTMGHYSMDALEKIKTHLLDNVSPVIIYNNEGGGRLEAYMIGNDCGLIDGLFNIRDPKAFSDQVYFHINFNNMGYGDGYFLVESKMKFETGWGKEFDASKTLVLYPKRVK